MQKIPTLFERNPDDRAHLTTKVRTDCQWVIDGEGVATRKYDGTCVMLDDDGRWWARREVKPGKNPPPNYLATGTDEVTGKTMGWEPMLGAPYSKMHAQALCESGHGSWVPGTYELCGPKINGNPEHYARHVLVPHATAEPIDLFENMAPDFDDFEFVFTGAIAHMGWEGIVWHHPDGRMAKLKVRDFR